MTDKKITDLAALTGANVADGDLFPLVDVSDTTMAATGTNKKITRAELVTAVGAGFQPLDADLTAIAGLTSAANKLPYFTGSGTAGLADFTAAGRALVDDADASAQRTTLGLGTAATTAATDYATAAQGATADAAIPKSLVDAKGDLLTATADNTPARLAVGTDGQVVTADSTQSSGLAYTYRNAGVLPALAGKYYYQTSGATTNQYSAPSTAGTARGIIVPVVAGVQIAQFGCQVDTAQAGKVIRLAVYATDWRGQPVGGSVLATGTVATDSTGKKLITSAFTPTSNWIAMFACPTTGSCTWKLLGYSNNTTRFPYYLCDSSGNCDMGYTIAEDCSTAYPSSPTFSLTNGHASQPWFSYVFA